MAGLRQTAAQTGAGIDLVFLQRRLSACVHPAGSAQSGKICFRSWAVNIVPTSLPGALHSRLAASVLGTVALPRSKRKEISCRLLRNPAPALGGAMTKPYCFALRANPGFCWSSPSARRKVGIQMPHLSKRQDHRFGAGAELNLGRGWCGFMHWAPGARRAWAPPVQAKWSNAV